MVFSSVLVILLQLFHSLTVGLCRSLVSGMPLPNVRQRQVGTHRRGAVANQACKVVGAPALPGTHNLRLDSPYHKPLPGHEGGLGSQALLDEVVMNGPNRQQGWNSQNRPLKTNVLGGPIQIPRRPGSGSSTSKPKKSEFRGTSDLRQHVSTCLESRLLASKAHNDELRPVADGIRRLVA